MYNDNFIGRSTEIWDVFLMDQEMPTFYKVRVLMLGS